MEHAALILEGGALRGFFTFGVLDQLMVDNIKFEYVNGVSAGALSAQNYISCQPKRNYYLNSHFLHDKNYIGARKLVFRDGLFNLDFAFTRNVTDYFPFDIKTYEQSKQNFEVAATDLTTG